MKLTALVSDWWWLLSTKSIIWAHFLTLIFAIIQDAIAQAQAITLLVNVIKVKILFLTNILPRSLSIGHQICTHNFLSEIFVIRTHLFCMKTLICVIKVVFWVNYYLCLINILICHYASRYGSLTQGVTVLWNEFILQKWPFWKARWRLIVTSCIFSCSILFTQKIVSIAILVLYLIIIDLVLLVRQFCFDNWRKHFCAWD